MKPKPLFLLDEMIGITEEEKKSGLYIPHNHFTYNGISDQALLKKAIEKQLTLITKDKGMIIRALIIGVNIIFQEDWGRRYYVYGTRTEYLGHVRQTYQKHLSRHEKTAKIISKVIPPKICISGFHQITCI